MSVATASRSVLSEAETLRFEPESLDVVFGRAFLVALERLDRDQAMVFARALLTRFSSDLRQPR